MIIVITGPTATGKTKLSIELAKKYNGEIINADSTQVYKDLDIATAKVTEEEKENIVHHLINIKTVNDDYSVYDYQKDCRKKIEEIKEKNKTPIIVGGTGLYIKAALFDYQFKEEEKYNYDNYSNDELYNELLKYEPDTIIHKNNRQRLERRLNFYQNNNIITNGKDKLLYPDTIFIALTTNRDLLYKKINDRVDVMINNGLLDEAKKIYNLNIKSKAILTPIGYKELFPYFENKCTLEEAIDLIKQRSRRYAKRQYTWFNHQLNLKWFNVDYDNFNNTINAVTQYINEVK